MSIAALPRGHHLSSIDRQRICSNKARWQSKKGVFEDHRTRVPSFLDMIRADEVAFKQIAQLSQATPHIAAHWRVLSEIAYRAP